MRVGLRRSQVLLRALVLAGPIVAVLCSGPAGQWPPWWVVAFVGLLAAISAVAPDSPYAAGALVVAVTWWVVGTHDGLHPMVLVAAGALVAAHVAALLASYGPREMPLDGPTARLWARRAVLVLLTVPPVWGAALLLRGVPEPPAIWPVAVAVALAATVLAALVLAPGRAEPDR